jgi:endonuclease YncB( thermonuclease family)
MKKITFFTILAVGLIFLDGIDAEAATLKGTCVKVSEGDTIFVRVARRTLEIRLAGVDCPEEGQDFFAEAREFTAARALKKKVTVEVSSFEGERQLIGRVAVEEMDLSLPLVEEGLAWYYKETGADKSLAKAQKKAKKNKVGLWSQPNPVAPWIYRKIKAPPQQPQTHP